MVFDYKPGVSLYDLLKIWRTKTQHIPGKAVHYFKCFTQYVRYYIWFCHYDYFNWKRILAFNRNFIWNEIKQQQNW